MLENFQMAPPRSPVQISTRTTNILEKKPQKETLPEPIFRTLPVTTYKCCWMLKTTNYYVWYSLSLVSLFLNPFDHKF